MAGRGRRMIFHGSFESKEAAHRKHLTVPHSFVKKLKDGRWGVLTSRAHAATHHSYTTHHSHHGLWDWLRDLWEVS